MAGFRFRAQPALDLRRREYEVAQRVLARADAERHQAHTRVEAAECASATCSIVGCSKENQTIVLAASRANAISAGRAALHPMRSCAANAKAAAAVTGNAISSASAIANVAIKGGWLAVSVQSMRAATANPADTLRYE